MGIKTRITGSRRWLVILAVALLPGGFLLLPLLPWAFARRGAHSAGSGR